ncbi:MAG TPA: hypothetical protein VM283_03520, partial [Armatimonadota bacterium]|nr:hypothetical protein [Armatimonadota bacterium]
REANRDSFLRCLDAAAQVGLSSVLPPGPRALRIASRWFRTDQGATMAVHLANYDLQVDTTSVRYYIVTVTPSVMRPVGETRIVARVPDGWHASAVRWLSYPSLERTPLQFTALRDGVAFTAPAFESYGLAAVELAEGPAQAQATVDEQRGESTSATGTLRMLEAGQTQTLQWTYGADAPGEADAPLSATAGVPIITNAAAGDTIELHLHGQTGDNQVVWDPATLGDEWSLDTGVSSWLRFWVIGPQGGIVASGAVPGLRDTVLKVPAAQDGLYVLMTEPGAGELRISSSGRCLVALGKPFTFMPAGEQRAYFWVPRGLREIKIAASSTAMQYSGRWQVLDPEGNAVVDREDVNVHGKTDTIPVPEGMDGKVWSFSFTSQARQTVSVDLLSPLPGYVAADPGRLAVFGD